MQEFLTEVTAKKPLALDIVELQVKLVLPAFMQFQAGQFMEFKVGTEYRCYSLTQPPVAENATLTFVIKLEPKGVGSDYIRELRLGDEVVMRGPNGFFIISDFGQPVVLVAGGVGIAPFGAIVPDLLTYGYSKDLHLLFGVRNEEHIFYFERFSHLAKQYPNFHFTPMLSRPESHWPGATGYVTTELEVNFPQFKDNVFYLCGSPAMVSEVRHFLLKLGVKQDRIKQEIFIS